MDQDNHTKATDALDNFKGIYYHDDQDSRFQDEETGAHFEYTDMCRRLNEVINQRNRLEYFSQFNNLNQINLQQVSKDVPNEPNDFSHHHNQINQINLNINQLASNNQINVNINQFNQPNQYNHIHVINKRTESEEAKQKSSKDNYQDSAAKILEKRYSTNLQKPSENVTSYSIVKEKSTTATTGTGQDTSSKENNFKRTIKHKRMKSKDASETIKAVKSQNPSSDKPEDVPNEFQNTKRASSKRMMEFNNNEGGGFTGKGRIITKEEKKLINPLNDKYKRENSKSPLLQVKNGPVNRSIKKILSNDLDEMKELIRLTNYPNPSSSISGAKVQNIPNGILPSLPKRKDFTSLERRTAENWFGGHERSSSEGYKLSKNDATGVIEIQPSQTFYNKKMAWTNKNHNGNIVTFKNFTSAFSNKNMVKLKKTRNIVIESKTAGTVGSEFNSLDQKNFIKSNEKIVKPNNPNPSISYTITKKGRYSPQTKKNIATEPSENSPPISHPNYHSNFSQITHTGDIHTTGKGYVITQQNHPSTIHHKPSKSVPKVMQKVPLNNIQKVIIKNPRIQNEAEYINNFKVSKVKLDSIIEKKDGGTNRNSDGLKIRLPIRGEANPFNPSYNSLRKGNSRNKSSSNPHSTGGASNYNSNQKNGSNR